MALTSSTSRTERMKGNGSNKEFSFSFRAWKEGQIAVYVGDGTTDSLASGVTVSLDASGVGGKVVFATAPSSSQYVVVAREMPFIQDDEYRNGTRFDPHEIEDRFDQDCAERQELRDGYRRSIKVPVTSDKSPEQYEKEFWTAHEEALDARDRAEAGAAYVKAQKDGVVSAIRTEGADQVWKIEQVGNIQASRLDNLVSMELVAKGLSCAETTWQLLTDVAAGTVVDLPTGLKYIVGHHHIRLSYDGIALSQTWWEEIGTIDTLSTKVKLKMDFKAGQELNVWIAPLKYDGEVDQRLLARIVTLENSLADLSRRVVYADKEEESNG